MTAGNVFGFINRNDHALMHRIHRWPAPDWLRFVMLCTTKAGDGWLWLGLGSVILGFGDGSRFEAAIAGASSCAVGLSIYTLIKNTTRRKRPCLVEPHQWARMLPPDQYSFPSGHTIAAFSIATSVSGFYPATMPALFWCALMIATSRVMLGMHFLSDVIVGALVGTTLGYVVLLLL